jgi:AcrR family transcriptional regulator
MSATYVYHHRNVTAQPTDELLEAGRRTFAKFGYHGATAERIADEAGISRVTLHRRGVNKEAILAELSRRAVDAYRAALWPALTADGSGAERLRLALAALCEEAEANLALLVALRSQADAVFHEPGPEAMTRSVFTQPIERLLRDGATDGSLRTVDSEEVATVLFNLVGWTYMHLRTGHGWTPERAARHLISIAIDGLIPQEDGTR